MRRKSASPIESYWARLLLVGLLVSSGVHSFLFSPPAFRTTLSPESKCLFRNQELFMARDSFYEDDDEEEEDDDDDLIDVDTLGDWRTFRQSLAASETPQTQSVSHENAQVLESQNQELAREYKTGVWAHATAVPEVGGLVVRMPLEVEIFRNYKHSLTGRQFRKLHANVHDQAAPAVWYTKAQSLVEESMLQIAAKAGKDGQIDASSLNDSNAELLQLYLDNQETWQEVCLVVDRNEKTGQATTVVLNRPMALKLTENLARLVLNGAYRSSSTSVVKLFGDDDNDKVDDRQNAKELIKFMLAFGQECAVYIGGPDEQDKPAEILHGIANLPGACEISPGSRIYRGGLPAAIDGVLNGQYKPLDFKFFVGRHVHKQASLDVSVVLGKYQPIACARSLALKQCLSLPKPLWHEVMELCNGEMKDISKLELMKRDDVRFQIVDEDDFDPDDLPDELDELERFDEDDEDYY